MKTETLRNLVASFESDQAYLETVARFEANPARQAWAGQRAGMVAMIVGQSRGEIMSRDTPDARPSGAAQQFESYLERVLEDYFDMGDSSCGRARASVRQAI